MSGCRKHKRKVKYRRRPFVQRRDLITRMLVEIGISYAETLGSEKTSSFLREKNVPEPVITRVIVAEW
jgi:hypothetical protein